MNIIKTESALRSMGKGLEHKTLETPAAAAPAQDEQRRLHAAAVKFEAFFVAQMLQQMRQATSALADADSALKKEPNQMPLALADQAVADAMASTRAFGIADMLVRQMSAPGMSASAPSQE